MIFDLLTEISGKRLNHASVKRVFESIKTNGGTFSVKEISTELGLHQGEVSLAITKLLNEELILLSRFDRQRRYYIVNKEVENQKEAALRQFLAKTQQ